MARFLVLAVMLLSSCIPVTRLTPNQVEIMSTVRLSITSNLVLPTGVEIPMGASCSAVAIGPNTLLTAAHCVDTAPPEELAALGVTGSLGSIELFDYLNQPVGTATVLKVDAVADLALLATTDVMPVTGDISSWDLALGEQVQVTGYPGGTQHVVLADGYCTTVMNTEDFTNDKLACSTPVIGGSSGGPVWYRGRIIGIISAGAVRFHHDTFAVAWGTIVEFLK